MRCEYILLSPTILLHPRRSFTVHPLYHKVTGEAALGELSVRHLAPCHPDLAL